MGFQPVSSYSFFLPLPWGEGRGEGSLLSLSSPIPFLRTHMTQYPTPDDRFKQLPKSLQAKSKHIRLGDTLGNNVPALIVHPDLDKPQQTPRPWVLWFHGRTVYKELDPGRYNRWARAGIGSIAIDLPGHGERLTKDGHSPSQTIHNLTQAINEIPAILESVADLQIFDMKKSAIGGMSAGGMIALRYLCNQHHFLGATIECTTGDLLGLYFPPDPSKPGPWRIHHDRTEVQNIDTQTHLANFKPIPLLAMHNKGDEVIPYELQSNFIQTLSAHYTSHNADPNLIQFITYDNTGTIQEHAGFGKYASQAKDHQLTFLKQLFNL